MKALLSTLGYAFAVLVSAPAEAQDRSGSPMFVDDGVAEFWQDSGHPRGVWRWATMDSYRSDTPEWETLLDLDQLARDEGRNWVWRGANCPEQSQYSCLIDLSDGGDSAITVREFFIDERTFADPELEDGFALPPGRHRIVWEDDDSLLVATDFGPDASGEPTVTRSGHPFTVRRWKRGETLAEAREVFRGEQSDEGDGVRPVMFSNGSLALVVRALDASRNQVWRIDDDQPPQRLALPEKLAVHGAMPGPSVSFQLEDSALDGYVLVLVLTTGEPWTFEDQTYPAGALLAPLFPSLTRGDDSFRVDSYRDPLVFSPVSGQSVADVDVSTGRIVATVRDGDGDSLNVFYRDDARQWRRFTIPTPLGTSVRLGETEPSEDIIFYSYEGRSEPRTLAIGNFDLLDWAIEGAEGQPPASSATSLTEIIGTVATPAYGE